jgi:hypothetical protein
MGLFVAFAQAAVVDLAVLLAFLSENDDGIFGFGLKK